MGLDPTSRARFNLSQASVLILDNTPIGLSILVQIVTGLGARHIHRCENIEQAQEAVLAHQIDLAIIDAMSPSGDGYEFVRWMRKSTQDPNCYAPVLVTTAHTPVGDVNKARDYGGHFVIKKPIAPVVMLERILWVANEARPFLIADTYVGPDRRFHDVEPPGGVGRRRDDAEKNTAESPATLEIGDPPSTA